MSAVEVCPDCDIAGCTHIRNRTGAFAAPSQSSVSVEELADTLAEADSDYFDYEEQARFILAKYNVTVKG